MMMMMTKTKTTVIIANHVRTAKIESKRSNRKLTTSWLQLKKRSNKRRIRKRLTN